MLKAGVINGSQDVPVRLNETNQNRIEVTDPCICFYFVLPLFVVVPYMYSIHTVERHTEQLEVDQTDAYITNSRHMLR